VVQAVPRGVQRLAAHDAGAAAVAPRTSRPARPLLHRRRGRRRGRRRRGHQNLPPPVAVAAGRRPTALLLLLLLVAVVIHGRRLHARAVAAAPLHGQGVEQEDTLVPRQQQAGLWVHALHGAAQNGDAQGIQELGLLLLLLIVTVVMVMVVGRGGGSSSSRSSSGAHEDKGAVGVAFGSRLDLGQEAGGVADEHVRGGGGVAVEPDPVLFVRSFV
jgi:hypothetical protein